MAQPSVILATTGYDHTIRFWEPKNKHYVAAAGNPHIRLYEVNSASPQPVISYSHSSNVMAVGFQCDGNWMYSGSEDGTVKIWDLRAPGCQREYESRAAVNTVVLHPNQDGSLVVAANNHGTCYVWRLMCGMQSNEHSFFLSLLFETIRRFTSMTNFEPLHKLQADNGYILKCLLSPEFCGPHRYLATASSDHTVKIWNVDGFTLEKTLVASSDTTARLWKMDSGEAIRVYQGHHKAVVCCALHDGAESSQS
ncbi:hypothetical protein MKX01_041349 [Papaver californicum]|nr:hypothetical protein MKX01_041349 [Papaver californicum]